MRTHTKMIKSVPFISILTFSGMTASAQQDNVETLLSEELTEKQDHLSGDVQELIELQTQEGVIVKLGEMETFMVETTLKLLDDDTGGDTLAVQTEIIEKAYEAAQEKQKSQSKQTETDQALMDMLKKMMGKEDSEESGKKTEKEKKGKSAGNGKTGDGSPEPSDKTTEASSLPTGSVRTVPSAAPTTGELLPTEFQDLIDDYNK